MRAYGPFSDEQLFYYDDYTILKLDQFQIYDSAKSDFIGFDDLQVIYDKGKKANFNNIFFGGIATINDVRHNHFNTNTLLLTLFIAEHVMSTRLRLAL